MIRVAAFLPGTSSFPLTVNRYAHWVNRRFPKTSRRNRALRVVLMACYYLGAFLSVVTRRIHIEEGAVIGPGLRLGPGGNIIIGAERMGAGCRVESDVTIGFGFTTERFLGKPKIGDNVRIRRGSLVYGNIRIGDGVEILEHTVVNKSLPANVVVAGNPCKIVRRPGKSAERDKEG